jgi:hypothetical protein
MLSVVFIHHGEEHFSSKLIKYYSFLPYGKFARFCFAVGEARVWKTGLASFQHRNVHMPLFKSELYTQFHLFIYICNIKVYVKQLILKM